MVARNDSNRMLEVVEPQGPLEQKTRDCLCEHRSPASHWEVWVIAAIYAAGVINALIHVLQ